MVTHKLKLVFDDVHIKQALQFVQLVSSEVDAQQTGTVLCRRHRTAASGLCSTAGLVCSPLEHVPPVHRCRAWAPSHLPR
jgi:hypothetical protein